MVGNFETLVLATLNWQRIVTVQRESPLAAWCYVTLLFTVRVTFSCVSWVRCDTRGGPCRIAYPMCLSSQMCSFAFYSSGAHLQRRALSPPFGPSATRLSPLHPVSASDVACCWCPTAILMSNLVTRPPGARIQIGSRAHPASFPKDNRTCWPGGIPWGRWPHTFI